MNKEKEVIELNHFGMGCCVFHFFSCLRSSSFALYLFVCLTILLLVSFVGYPYDSKAGRQLVCSAMHGSS